MVEGTVGRIYGVLGKYDRARTHLELAPATQSSILPFDDPGVLKSRQDLELSLSMCGDIEEARTQFEELQESCIEILRTTVDRCDARHAAAVNSLAAVLPADVGPATADPLLRDNLQLMRELRLENHPDTLLVEHALAPDQERLAKVDEAIELYEDLVVTDDDWRLSALEHGLGRILLETGDEVRAWPALERAHQVFEAALGSDHANTLRVVDRLEGRPEYPAPLR